MLAEIKDPNTCTSVKRLLREDKLERLEENSLQEIRDFQRTYSELGEGETDVILTWQKLSSHQDNVYCILDDGNARNAASKLSVRYTGMIGLLQMLKTRGIKSPGEIREIFKLLKEGGFRIPKHIDINGVLLT